MEYNNRLSLWTILKRFLLTVLLVAVLIFVLLWIFPTKSSLNPLLQEVFRNNINSMKDAAETYFTNERMPGEVGEKVRITLGEMLEKKLLLPFTDKNGKSCDNNKSYVEITKTETEYEMVVNLSCSSEEAYIIEHLGCTDRCIDCKQEEEKKTTNQTNNNTKKTVNKYTEYEFKKAVSTQKFDKYECPEGYTQDKSNPQACYKNVQKIETINATANKTTETKNATAKKDTEVIKATVNKTTETENATAKYTYKYKYVKTTGKTYSAWSAWSEDKEYDPNNNNIVWGVQELVDNEKNGYLKTTITTTQIDTSKPIYNYSYDNLVGTYKQYVCDGYTYFRDSSTSTTYSTGEWVYSKQITSETQLTSTLTTKYVYVGMDYTKCSSTCTLKPYYIYKVYTRTINKETRTYSQLSATCNVVEKTINVYGMKKTFAGYVTNKVPTEKYTYYYHTRTRTITSNGTTSYKWSTSSDDASLIKDGYKYTGEKEVTKTTYTCPSGYTLNGTKCEKEKTTYACPSGYTLNGIKCEREKITYTCPSGYTLNGTKCEKEVTTYTCPSGYTRSGTKCEREVTVKETKNATAKYKTVNGETYTWSKNKSLSGWTSTGRTRTVEA